MPEVVGRRFNRRTPAAHRDELLAPPAFPDGLGSLMLSFRISEIRVTSFSRATGLRKWCGSLNRHLLENRIHFHYVLFGWKRLSSHRLSFDAAVSLTSVSRISGRGMPTHGQRTMQ